MLGESWYLEPVVLTPESGVPPFAVGVTIMGVTTLGSGPVRLLLLLRRDLPSSKTDTMSLQIIKVLPNLENIQSLLDAKCHMSERFKEEYWAPSGIQDHHCCVKCIGVQQKLLGRSSDKGEVSHCPN